MEAVGQLAGGIAHDFNNLLTVILGYSQLLIGELDLHDPRRAEVVEIHRAGESAAALTRQLLAFSRKQIIAPTVLDMNAVIGNLRGMLRRLIGEDVQIIFDLSRDPMLVLADGGQLEQIVMNLSVNARDAMPSGGTLTITTRRVHFDEQYASSHVSVEPGSYVSLTVSDTGIGMSAETQARVFEPFFTTKAAGKGTGLGLATVHGIVLRGGGSLAIDSEVGRGTSLSVYLPSAAAGVVVADASVSTDARTTGQTILVVEDAEGLGELTRRMLELQGYKVLLAGQASEALELFERHPHIDVILTDVVMPGGSGPELITRLTGRRPEMKVIYMSGYTDDAIAQRGVLDPEIAFLHKPYTMETLARKLREVLDR
jgi:two-component system cell cycle sensor histidine kinase/response regulator CckA